MCIPALDASAHEPKWPKFGRFANRHLAMEMGIVGATPSFFGNGQLSPFLSFQLHSSMSAPAGVWLDIASAPWIEVRTGRCEGIDCIRVGRAAILIPGAGLYVATGPIDMGAVIRLVAFSPVVQASVRASWMPGALGVTVEVSTYVTSLRDQYGVALMARWRPRDHPR